MTGRPCWTTGLWSVGWALCSKRGLEGDFGGPRVFEHQWSLALIQKAVSAIIFIAFLCSIGGRMPGCMADSAAHFFGTPKENESSAGTRPGLCPQNKQKSNNGTYRPPEMRQQRFLKQRLRTHPAPKQWCYLRPPQSHRAAPGP